jgi:hypothetical protein
MVDLAEYVNVIPGPSRGGASKNAVGTASLAERDAAAKTGNLGALRPCHRRKNEGARQEYEAPKSKTSIAEDPSVYGAPRGGREKAYCRHSFHFSLVVDITTALTKRTHRQFAAEVSSMPRKRWADGVIGVCSLMPVSPETFQDFRAPAICQDFSWKWRFGHGGSR